MSGAAETDGTSGELKRIAAKKGRCKLFICRTLSEGDDVRSRIPAKFLPGLLLFDLPRR